MGINQLTIRRDVTTWAQMFVKILSTSPDRELSTSTADTAASAKSRIVQSELNLCRKGAALRECCLEILCGSLAVLYELAVVQQPVCPQSVVIYGASASCAT